MPTYRRVQDIDHEIGPHGALSLAVTSADVRLTATAGASARVRATFEIGAASDQEADEAFETLRLSVHAADGTLAVDEPDGHRGLGGAISRLLAGRTAELYGVEVEAPAGCRLEVRVVSSDVQASGFHGSQHVQSVSGDLRLIDAGGDLDIDSVSGDVSLRAIAPVSLTMNNVSGDLSAQAPTFEHLRIQSVSGDMSVDGELSAETPHAVDTVSGDFRLASGSGITVAVRGMSTDIHSALPHRLDGRADRRRLVLGDGAATVAFNSMSGDLAVTRSRQRPGQVEASVAPAAPAAPAAPTADERSEILGALERGEIDVDEAMHRLGDRA